MFLTKNKLLLIVLLVLVGVLSCERLPPVEPVEIDNSSVLVNLSECSGFPEDKLTQMVMSVSVDALNQDGSIINLDYRESDVTNSTSELIQQDIKSPESGTYSITVSLSAFPNGDCANCCIQYCGSSTGQPAWRGTQTFTELETLPTIDVFLVGCICCN